MDEFQDRSGGGQRDRPRGVNFKKIQELRDSTDDKDVHKLGKKVQIFFKRDNRAANEPLMRFTSEYLAIFSERYRSSVWDENAKAVTIIGGDKAVYKQLFDWMLDSVNQDTPAAASVPEYDESTSEIFRKYATLILAAEYLQIPARDFADSIIKKILFKMSREKLMSWDEVNFYLESFQGDTDTDEKMREVLTNSIANAWWKGNLKEAEDEDEDDYCILSVLRAEHSQFDEGLHTWCEKNETRIRGKWAEKNALKNGGGGGGGGETGDVLPGSCDWDTAGTSAVVSDWGTGGDVLGGKENGDALPEATGGWEDSGISMASSSQKENIAPAEAAGWDTSAMPSVAAVGGDWDDGGHGGDWAEEVNADKQTSW